MASANQLILFLILICSLQLVTSELVRLPLRQEGMVEKSNLRNTIANLNAKPGMSIRNYLNLNYVSTIHIGAEKKPFDVILDTGSEVLWIPDTSLNLGKAKFACSTSKTCVNQKSKGPFNIKYGKGSVTGYRITDTLRLGNLTIPNFDIVLATEVRDLDLKNFDGLIGLSLGQFRTDSASVLGRLKQNNLIKNSVFSIYLGDRTFSYGSNTGEIIFGGYDPQYALSEFQFIKVKKESESSFWMADLIGVAIGSESISTQSYPAIFDTGTSFLFLPQLVITKILAKAKSLGLKCQFDPKAGQDVCDCEVQKRMPDLVFAFNGVTLNVPPTSYFGNIIGLCFLAASPMKNEPNLTNPIILGDALLKNYYTMYSAHNYTVGFAKPPPVKNFNNWIGIFIILLALIVCLLAFKIWRRRYDRSKASGYRSFSNSKGINIGGGKGYSGTHPLAR